ncbi:MAG: reverse transcriptase domain-containing protein [Candidatus Competibacterales bacterium]|nr:reverse transcriptase domain-containing protein [Candidatus Competibacterales bacterium]
MIKRLLGDAKRYEAQIEHLHLKYLQKNRTYQVQQDGVAFASINFDARRFSRRIADTVAAGEYRFTPAKTRILHVGARERLLYQFQLTDLIVHGVVSTIINEAMEPHLSPHLYSYRRGVRWWDAVSALARYVRVHQRMQPEIKARGLYVLRRDVSKYTDSIRVDARSEVWNQVWQALNGDRFMSRREHRYWALVEQVIRPEIVSSEGLRYSNLVGVPTGSPISTTLFNLYLMSVDRELDAIPGGFYARYSDDILFAHPDPHVTRLVDETLSRSLAAKGLKTNADKDQLLYFNGAGRPSRAWPRFRGTTQVAFLGCNVSFHGVISLNGRKMQHLLKDVSTRARRALAALEVMDRGVVGPTVCAAVNEALDPDSPARHKHAALLRHVVTSRQQLKEADYQIARIVARSLTGSASVKAFRQIPYQTMRRDWKLVSLCQARNKAS